MYALTNKNTYVWDFKYLDCYLNRISHMSNENYWESDNLKNVGHCFMCTGDGMAIPQIMKIVITTITNTHTHSPYISDGDISHHYSFGNNRENCKIPKNKECF